MNVTVFSSSTCAICHSEMQWLDKLGVKYENVVVDESDEAMTKMLEATNGVVQGTPLTLIENGSNKELVTGFDRVRIKRIIGLN